MLRCQVHKTEGECVQRKCKSPHQAPGKRQDKTVPSCDPEMQKTLCGGPAESPQKAEIEKSQEGEPVDNERGVAQKKDSALITEQSPDEPDEYRKADGEKDQEVDEVGGKPPCQ